MITVKLAGYVFRISNRYSYIESMSKDFASYEEPHFYIEISEYEINKEISKGCSDEDKGYCESLAIYRKICEILASKKIVLIHGAFFQINNIGLLFTGKSGAGKSTQLSKWSENLGDQLQIINGDKPLFEVGLDSIKGFGTPWSGKERLYSNTSHGLSAILLVEKNKNFEIKKLETNKSLDILLSQTFFPMKGICNLQVIDSLKKILNQIPIFVYKTNLETKKKSEEIREVLKILGEYYEN